MLNVTLLGISINMSLTCETLIVSRLGTLMLMEQTNEKKNISIKMLTKRIHSNKNSIDNMRKILSFGKWGERETH